MTPERLTQIEKSTERYLKQAERILEGDDEYDGADGARNVQDIACQCLELIDALKAK